MTSSFVFRERTSLTIRRHWSVSEEAIFGVGMAMPSPTSVVLSTSRLHNDGNFGMITLKENGGMAMLRTITVENMRMLEAAANQGGLSETALMENAGAAAAREIGVRYATASRPVTVLCGGGNNGGDGYVVARLLSLRGAKVTVVETERSPGTESARHMRDLADDGRVTFLSLTAEPYLAAASVKGAVLIVDAVYGIGFHGRLPDPLRTLFRVVHESGVPVVALDVPSGLNAETGEWDEDALRAALTVTFTAAKPAMAVPAAQERIGELKVVSVGIDEQLVAVYCANVGEIRLSRVSACFPKRSADCHKGDFGRLLCVAGSVGMAGAAMMAGRAALRCGLGILEMAVPRDVYPVLGGQMPQAVFTLLPQNDSGSLAGEASDTLISRLPYVSALVVGCGLGTSEPTANAVLTLLQALRLPAVADADALTLLASHPDAWEGISAPLVLTPHPGEMARLTGLTIQKVQSDRVGTARRFAVAHGVTLVLKGYRTVVACPDGQVWVNPTGCPGMATGGSGDVLAGMIGSFLAQGMTPQQAAICGVYLHGAAGEKAAAALSQVSMLPTDIIDRLPSVFLEMESAR